LRRHLGARKSLGGIAQWPHLNTPLRHALLGKLNTGNPNIRIADNGMHWSLSEGLHSLSTFLLLLMAIFSDRCIYP